MNDRTGTCHQVGRLAVPQCEQNVAVIRNKHTQLGILKDPVVVYRFGLRTTIHRWEHDGLFCQGEQVPEFLKPFSFTEILFVFRQGHW